MMLQIGNDAPNITLKNQDGIEVSLSDFKHQWVVLYFYPKDDTTGCTIQACEFSENIDGFSSLNATIIGVSPDDMTKHQKFIGKYDIAYSLLCDEEHIALKTYEAWGLKQMYGKEYEGVIRSTFIINPDGKIAKLWSNVKSKGHALIVKEELQKLQN